MHCVYCKRNEVKPPDVFCPRCAPLVEKIKAKGQERANRKR